MPPPASAAPDRAVEIPSSPFERWVGDREVSHLGSNGGAEPLAFQRWHHFKEAFPPELIERMIDAAREERSVESCLDVFGGSGTTALASQLLGVASTTIEINPFLADVIRAKVTAYDPDELARDLDALLEAAAKAEPTAPFPHVPATFIEPGTRDRWVFDRAVAKRLAGLLGAIEAIEAEERQRFFRVMVGGILTEVSNVVINGKGRRYRRSWRERRREESSVLALFEEHAREAIADVRAFADRPDVEAEVLLGDAREKRPGRKHDLAIISPPYPNSFDYTDIYNLELWMLGYLDGSAANRTLREATLSSHVQLHREFDPAPGGSKSLAETTGALEEIRDQLWNPWIPAMVGGYFADLMKVLGNLRASLRERSRCCIVIGDSRYGGVLVPAARILGELSVEAGWEIHSAEPVRAMRSSAQHGGTADLAETLLILVKRG